MKKLIAGAAVLAAVGFVNFANAADMPMKAPVYKAPIAAAYDWSGIYIGGEAGWQGSRIGLNEPIRFDPSTDTVMARLSYKFDWPR